MKRHPGIFILFGMLLCCAAYCVPQFFSGSVQAEASFARYFLAFSAILAFIVFFALFLFDLLARLDRKLRAAALSPRWAMAGWALLFASGIVLVKTMIPWNDEQSNLEAARYLWGNGLWKYFEDYSTINKWLGRHHPPLLVLMYGLWYKITGFSLLAGRLLNLAFALFASFLTFYWIRKMTDKAIAGLAVICLAITPMWLFSSASALLDMPFVVSFLAAMIFFENYVQSMRPRDAALAGVFAAVTILSRYNGLFLFPIWGVMLVSHGSTRNLLRKPATGLLLGVPFALAIPWVILALVKGTFWVQVTRLSTFLLVGVVQPGGWWYLSEVLLPLFPITMGIFAIPVLLYGFSSGFRTNDAGVRRLLVGTITYLALIALTLPNPRYLLPMIPMLAAIYSLALWRLAAIQKGMVPVLGALMLCSAAFVIFYTWATAKGFLYIFY